MDSDIHAVTSKASGNHLPTIHETSSFIQLVKKNMNIFIIKYRARMKHTHTYSDIRHKQRLPINQAKASSGPKNRTHEEVSSRASRVL